MADEQETEKESKDDESQPGVSHHDLLPDEDDEDAEDERPRKGIREIRQSLEQIEEDLQEILGDEEENEESFDEDA